MHRPRTLPTLILAFGALVVVTAPGVGLSPPPAPRILLDQVRRAYADAGAFEETLRVTLLMPDGSRVDRSDTYGVTAEGGAYFSTSTTGSATLSVIARSDRAVAVWSHLPDRYAEAPYDGDLSKAFQHLQAGDAGFAVPAAVAAAQGADLASFLDALGFGALGPWTSVPRAPGAQTLLYEVELEAANGRVTLGIDPSTRRFRTVEIRIGAAPRKILGEGEFDFHAGASVDAPEWPPLAGRQAVASLPTLEAPRLQVGDPAPAIELRLSTGETLTLEQLEDQVVVLDFWATWCVPCWQGLEYTAELAAGAAASSRPVRVFAVDTLERTSDFGEQRELALGFLTSRGLDLPVVLDVGDRIFEAFGSPGLPSLFVIGPNGRIAARHTGLSPDLVNVVRAEIDRLLEVQP